MKKNIKIILSLVLLSGWIMTSCVKEKYEDTSTPATATASEVESGLTPTEGLTVAKLKSLYSSFEVLDADGEVRTFPDSEDYVFEGTVVSSDEQGNFYKELYVQDSTGGLILSIDYHNLYTNYEVGQTVHIKLSGLTVHYKTGNYETSMIVIGFGQYTCYGSKRIGRIPANILSDYVRNHSYVREVEPVTITLDNLSDDYIGRLIKINDVEFIDDEIGKTYAFDKHTTNRHIKDCAGNNILLRNSGYSSFQNDTMPQNKGSITAIYTKYGSNYQILIRDTTDLNFTKERCL